MIERLLPAGPHHRVAVRCTSRDDGDFRVDLPSEELANRRQAIAPGVWSWLRQVHGAAVVEVDQPGAGAGQDADGAVSTSVGAVLAVQTADCVPIVLASAGTVGVVHAGWRGVVAGVIPATVAVIRRNTDAPIHALVGPHIHAADYAFGADDLDTVCAVVGPSCRSTTSAGGTALDMAAAVDVALRRAGVDAVEHLGQNTAAEQWFSHRTRGDRGRQVTAAWLVPR